ncbi:MAG: hypothetical protein LKG42_04560 [Eubacterium sp.]|jgi:hypothetical protein|nr:hypothetical protein [Eubacterium sp.]MCH4047376.1 hypothetical protein [Eubacterium sp.]MCH4080473.1 hypothetical protein [Eubacterium sp.]MCI1307270.1 hypothetical protein [Eubacterium sp.]MCI1405715.1 hypothetical protein [Eubacterium sp.]
MEESNLNNRSEHNDYRQYQFELCKEEYEHEYERESSLDTRAGFLLAFISTVMAFTLHYCTLTSIVNLVNKGIGWNLMGVLFIGLYYLSLSLCIVNIHKVLKPTDLVTIDLNILYDDNHKLIAFGYKAYTQIISMMINCINKIQNENNKKADFLEKAIHWFLVFIFAIVVLAFMDR